MQSTFDSPKRTSPSGEVRFYFRHIHLFLQTIPPMNSLKITAAIAITLLLATLVSNTRPKSLMKKDAAVSNADSAMPKSSNLPQAESVYQQAQLAATGLPLVVFTQAWKGYQALAKQGIIKNQLLVIADLHQPSANKRLWIIDIAMQQLVKHTLVAHGRNSGLVNATRFSNQPESLQSSIGFFVTSHTYTGSNGYSLRLIGMEKGINDKAMERAIVMHGAAYVSESMARQNGRIGRSWGCPAVPMAEHRQIIDLIKGGSCLFIYAPQQEYASQSPVLQQAAAMHL